MPSSPTQLSHARLPHLSLTVSINTIPSLLLSFPIIFTLLSFHPLSNSGKFLNFQLFLYHSVITVWLPRKRRKLKETFYFFIFISCLTSHSTALNPAALFAWIVELNVSYAICVCYTVIVFKFWEAEAAKRRVLCVCVCVSTCLGAEIFVFWQVGAEKCKSPTQPS